jgi:hypothetical protein
LIYAVTAIASGPRQQKQDSEETPMRPVWLLLLIPYIGLLWVPFYNRLTPDLFGFPFFYWYQLLFVPITSLLIYIVYRQVRDER